MSSLLQSLNWRWEVALYAPSIFMWLIFTHLISEAPRTVEPYIELLIFICLVAAFVLTLVRSLRGPTVLRFIALVYALFTGGFTLLEMILGFAYMHHGE